MIRNTRLVCGLGALGLAVALLAGRPALAGNGGNNHGGNNHGNNGQWNSNHNGSNQWNHHGQNYNPAIKVQVGTWQGQPGFNYNYGGWNSTPIHVQTPVIYCVMVKQPNRYHDWDWHQVQCFGNPYDAKILASNLESRHFGDYGFAVRIDRRHW